MRAVLTVAQRERNNYNDSEENLIDWPKITFALLVGHLLFWPPTPVAARLRFLQCLETEASRWSLPFALVQ